MKWLRDFGLPLTLTLLSIVVTFLFYAVAEMKSVNSRIDLMSVRMDTISARLDFAQKSYTEISYGLIRLERAVLDAQRRGPPSTIEAPF